MIKTETIIAVKDVKKSSQWYQNLLHCESGHGGETFEILKNKDGTVILCLHKWGEHEHPTMINPEIPVGNGLILYFRIVDINKVWENTVKLKLIVEQSPHLNINSGKQQFILRDLDGYYIIVSE
jgi:hypothetical protein